MKVDKKRKLSVFVLAMLNVSMMASLRNLPLVAEYGLSALIYFFIVGLTFLVPSALISAELATGWPRDGGVYIWIREALGERMGFLGIWMQWVHNVAWFPVILAFVATTAAYTFNPDLAANKTYVLSVVLIGFWGMTVLNFFGIKTSSLVSTVGVIAGTIAPGALIIVLGVLWLLTGHPSQIQLTADHTAPHFDNLNHLIFLAGLFLAFGGLEVAAAHTENVENPQKNYPRAIILAALITFFLVMLGALSISVVIPHHSLNLVAGLMDAYATFFAFYKLEWFMPVLALLLIMGAVAELNSWIAGPVRALYSTARRGNLPPVLQYTNKRGVATNLLVLQAIIASVSAGVILFMPNVSSAFWILTALSAQTYLVMYILMFISAIRLRYTSPSTPRAYKVPFKTVGIWFFGGMGILSSLFCIVIAFFPPPLLNIETPIFYVSFLFGGLAILTAIPLIIYAYRKYHWYLPGDPIDDA